jgi:hypothetical protein
MGLTVLPTEIESLLRSVRPTTWAGNKVSAIDLSSNFAWLDDAPLLAEIAALRDRNLLSRLIVIDTNKDDDGLLRAKAAIEELAKGPLVVGAAARLERGEPHRGPFWSRPSQRDGRVA